MEFKRKLPIPAEIKQEFPVTDEITKIKAERDKQIKDVFSGESKKLILIIGPCSADNERSVLDYLVRLKRVADKVSEQLLIIPRVYTNKPRTTGDGYKGMLHQPNPDQKPDMLKGIIAIRQMHLDAVRETGFTCADEMLYPENYRYLSDLLSYVAVGARSVENQQHRLVSSGIDVPVGMKNPTSGDTSVMLNGILAAQHSHTFIYRGWEVETSGNKYAHAILRGYMNKFGQSIPNYHYEDLEELFAQYRDKRLVNESVIIDTNHCNSGKRYLEQIRIVKDVMHSMRHSGDVNAFVKGFMVESYLEDGCQPIGGGAYGKSITDPCLGWEKTERLIYDVAELQAKR